MHGELTTVVVVFGAALLAAWGMRRLRAPAILGFLVAGIVVGPSGLNLVGQERGHEQIHFMAELGLVFLLFTVGLELSPAPLLRSGRRIALAAVLQMAVTTAAVAPGLALATGMAWSAALLAALAVAPSSTPIVLKHLLDRGEADSPGGAVITGVTLLQDILAILVMVALPLLVRAGGSWGAFVLRSALAVGGLVGVTLLGHLAVPRVVNRVFRVGGRELMTLFAVLMACAGAWLASLADWSWPLGAFIAGLLLTQSDLRHQLQAEVQPLREVFSALFFVSIGMLVDLRLFEQHALALGLTILATLALKTLLAAAAVLVSGWPVRLAVAAGVGLCTISEFGYVLTREADKLGLLPPDFLPLFVTWAVGTMIIGALFVPAGSPLGLAAARWLPATRPPAGPAAVAGLEGAAPGRMSHVIIVGYGLNGRNLGRVLRATRIPFVVVELHRGNAHLARQDGADVIVGDATRIAILERAGLAAARALVISIADAHATRRIVAQARAARPDLYILARTRYLAELDALYRAGARQVIPEEFETSIEIFAHVLKEFGIPANVIEQQVTLVRAGHYGMLRGRPTDQGVRVEWLQLLEAAVTQTYLVLEGSPAAGRSIRELDLRSRTGVTVVALTRAGKPIANPSPDLQLAAGDVLVLVGTHRQLDEARRMFEPPVVPAEES